MLGLLQQETVRDMVTSPLNTLLALFEAPGKVIQKRFDKLLDYDSMQRKVTDGRVRVIFPLCYFWPSFLANSFRPILNTPSHSCV